MAKKQSQNTDVLDAIAGHKHVVPQDKLKRVSDLMVLLRDYELQIKEREQQISDLKVKRLRDNKSLQDLMIEVKMSSFSLEASGNAPAFEAEIRNVYYASIAADWDEPKRSEAFKLLEKKQAGDLIKTVITTALGKDTAKQQKEVRAALRKLKVPFDEKRSVPFQTLTAYVREKFETGDPLSPAEMATLGASASAIVVVKEKK